MLSFRQKILISYLTVFLLFLLLMFPIVTSWVNHIIFQAMESRVNEIIANIKGAANDEDLVDLLKDQKSIMFFRSSIITDQRKVLYDSHTKRLLGEIFSQDYVVEHPEVEQAFKEGTGYYEGYSQILNQDFSYFAKAFKFHGRIYVLRAAFPHQYVMEITHDFEIGFLAFSSVILLMFSVMTWLMMNHLTKPIQKIINAVKPYQDGKEQGLPEIKLDNLNPSDDFGKLALTLNSLSKKIQSHIDEITLERNEKEAILESLAEGVIAVDVDMRIVYVNQMATKLLKQLNKKVIGENFSNLNEKKCESLLEQCQEEGKLLTDTLEVKNESKKLYLDIVASPKKGKAGAILVLQDKTSHYKIFEMRRDFIANASHELKTPITVIRGFAEALHDNEDVTKEMRELMTGKIVKSCIRMTSLIKDLLTLADIENIPHSRLSYCDVVELVKRCGIMLLEAHPDANFKIEQKQDKIGLVVDADLLELAIMNLIENAAKYSKPPAQITVTLDEALEEVYIKIQDKGIGIPEVDQEHIFDRFYTVDKAHSQKMGGSGLGLSIVKTIIEKHFGTIHLESELGKGTTFIIRLPILKIDVDSV
ncbi:MAG: ATP-binding protein [Parachlamydiaceae bacterium]|nr:ATP-binding protein [Parachlamydiaceae bacterium]